MSTFKIRYATATTALAHIEANDLSYSGGDGVVVAVFKGPRADQPTESVVAIAALQPGMIVERL